jgi:hypothetical protein
MGRRSQLDNHRPQLCPLLLHQPIHPCDQPLHRTELLGEIYCAGVSGWPRLFHSMRASRQTELQREFPLHVVCSWLGNSPRIAQQSYLLVTEDDFAKAAGAKNVMV